MCFGADVEPDADASSTGDTDTRRCVSSFVNSFFGEMISISLIQSQVTFNYSNKIKEQERMTTHMPSSDSSVAPFDFFRREDFFKLDFFFFGFSLLLLDDDESIDSS